MGKTNKLWHEQNRMPQRPSVEQRIQWHIAHAKHCACRAIPHGVVALMQERGIPMHASSPAALAELANLGPKSAQMLASVGITSVEQLREMGSVAAYAQAKRSGGNVSLNLLWALEGALTGLSWQEVARVHRTSLLLALEEYEQRA